MTNPRAAPYFYWTSPTAACVFAILFLSRGIAKTQAAVIITGTEDGLQFGIDPRINERT